MRPPYQNNNLRVTLDSIHQKHISEYDQKIKQLPKLKKQKTKLTQSLEKLKGIKNFNLTNEQIEEKFVLQTKIKEIEKEIKKLTENKDIHDYYLNVGDLLFQYYDKKKNPKLIKNNKPIIKNFNNKKNIIHFFQNNDSTISDINDNENNDNNDGNKINENINDNDNNENNDNDNNDNDNDNNDDYYKGNMKYLSKQHILSKYLTFTDEDYVTNSFSVNNQNYDKCKNCNKEMLIIFSEGIILCKDCGIQEDILINSDKPSYKEPPKEMSYFAYKRINHFNEWLAQFQAKESTEIPKEVFDKILVEIKKERITNMVKINQTKLRKILKKLKLNKYYEHVPHIINRLNGVQAPVMDRHTEEKLRMMFKEIQGPFMKHCPKTRKNFLSYSYVLHKFVQLLELDSFLPCFTLLKSREKLHQQDVIWQKICKDLKWEYIKSL